MQGKTVNTKITCLREAESCVCVWPCVSLLDPGLLTVTFHDCPQSPTKCLRSTRAGRASAWTWGLGLAFSLPVSLTQASPLDVPSAPR